MTEISAKSVSDVHVKKKDVHFGNDGKGIYCNDQLN